MPAGANCTISVTFTPTVTGTRPGTIVITDDSNNVAGTMQTVNLTGTGAAAGPAISGIGTKGGINGATVTVYAINADGSNGATLGTGTTDSHGAFTVNLSSLPMGAVRVVITGGTYVSEWDGAMVTGDSPISAIIDNPTTTITGLSVTAVSTFVDAYTAFLLKSGTVTVEATAHANAQLLIVGFYGFTAGSTVETILPSFLAADLTANPNNFLLGLILGTLDAEGKAANSADPDAFLAALSCDISDGVWDGLKSGTPCPLGGGRLSTTAGTSDFTSELGTYVNGSSTTTTPGSTAVTIALVSSFFNSVDLGVAGCLCTPASNGLANTSSGAINSLAFGGHQYLFVAARSEGVVVIDITDPTAASPLIKAWPQIYSNAPGSGWEEMREPRIRAAAASS